MDKRNDRERTTTERETSKPDLAVYSDTDLDPNEDDQRDAHLADDDEIV